MKRLAFIGLGSMGLPMARNLAAAGFELAVYDVMPERAQELDARAAASPREAAEGAEAAVLMVVNATQAEGALLDDEGAAAALPPGAPVVLMSTVGPEAVRALGERLAERSLALVDAPVSGGVRRAETGELLVMVGAPREQFERARPMFEPMAATVVHCGEAAGDGQSVKLVNQLLAGVHIVAAAEALAYAQRLGLDPGAVREIVRHGAAGSFMLEDRGERMVKREFVPARSAVTIFTKDLGLVLGAGEESEARTPLAQAALEAFNQAAALGLEAEDDAGVIRVFEA